MQTLSITKIIPDENQPRKYFNAEKLKTLKNSISQHGIVNPLVVQEISKDKFLLVDGERRFRAATELKLKEVPVLIEKPQKETDRLVRQFNIQEQHESWTPVEKAIAIDRLSVQMGLSLPQTCKLLNVTEGDARRYVAFSAVIDKDTWVKNEVPLDYAQGIAALKAAVRRLSEAELEKEFDRAGEKKLELRIIQGIKHGDIARRSDLVRLKDAFTKSPKAITEYLTNSKATPASLYISTKAKGAYNLRNAYMSAGYVVYHGNEFLKVRDVKLSAANISNFKAAIEVLKELVALAK